MSKFLVEAKFKGDESDPFFTPQRQGYDLLVKIGWGGSVRIVYVTGYYNTPDDESRRFYPNMKAFLESWQILKGLGEYERLIGPEKKPATDNQ